MVKRILVLLILSYFIYSLMIYCYGNQAATRPPADAIKGFVIWQSSNCQACHQLYGLGGYMGPDLTNLMSDPAKGSSYAYSFIKNGTQKMPKLGLTDQEIINLIAFLKWVDKSGSSKVPLDKVTPFGNYTL